MKYESSCTFEKTVRISKGEKKQRRCDRIGHRKTTNSDDCEINQSFWLLLRGVDTPRVVDTVILRRRLLSKKRSIDREIRSVDFRSR